MNPGGSIKDRTCKSIIYRASTQSNLSKSKTIFEGTSGSTGISLSLLANQMGYKTFIYLPNDLAKEKFSTLETCGAEIVKVPPVSITDPNHFVKKAEQKAKDTGSFFAN